ncbi:MAG: hypothetical protein M0036_13790 [Desulfobacteraceae bacterium]|nr:hypothetical protein [Desulfobacteraceae bacterium]
MYKELKKLDGIELEMLATMIEKDMHRIGNLLFPDRKTAEETLLMDIRQWAINRKAVLDSQSPNVALIFEKICYRIWQKLPSHAQSLKIKAEAIITLGMANSVSLNNQ